LTPLAFEFTLEIMHAGFESEGRDAMSGFCCFRSVLRRLAFVDALVADFFRGPSRGAALRELSRNRVAICPSKPRRSWKLYAARANEKFHLSPISQRRKHRKE